jgi:hypothetical protein
MTVQREVLRRRLRRSLSALQHKETGAVAIESGAAARIARRRALGLGALASLFAFVGRSAARAADALTINPDGEVSIDKLSVQKSLAVAGPMKIDGTVAGPIKIDGKNMLEFGAGVQKEQSAGQIAYQKHSTDALDILGAGTTVSQRKIKMWAEGGATLYGGLDVTGTVKAASLETNSGISLAAVQNALNSLIPVPIGTILLFGEDTNKQTVAAELKKQGWLPCDGATVSPKEYPDLFNVIGTSHGGYSGPTLTYFSVPNLHAISNLDLRAMRLSWIIKAQLVP